MNEKALSTYLMKFSSLQLSEVIPLVLGLEWNQIYEVITQKRLCLLKRYVVNVAMDLYLKTKPRKEDIEDVLKKVKLYDAASNDTHNWHGIKLVRKETNFPQIQNLEKNILSAYKTEARNAEVLIYEDEPLVFVMSTEKRITKKGIKLLSPIFFALHTNLSEQYVFYFPPTKNTHHLDYISRAVGYDGYAEISLNGKDVRCLFGIVENSLNPELDGEVPPFEPNTVNEGDGYVDFTRGEERLKYAEKVLPTKTRLNTFSVHANNEWAGSVPLETDEKFITSLTFTTRNHTSVEDMFKEMIKLGMVKFPIPPYIANLTKIPTNDIYLNSNEFSDSD